MQVVVAEAEVAVLVVVVKEVLSWAARAEALKCGADKAAPGSGEANPFNRQRGWTASHCGWALAHLHSCREMVSWGSTRKAKPNKQCDPGAS